MKSEECINNQIKTIYKQLFYWKSRCELAEKVLEETPCDPDIHLDQMIAWDNYKQFIKDNEMKWINIKDQTPECHNQHGDSYGSGYLFICNNYGEYDIDQYWKHGKHTDNGWIEEKCEWENGNDVTHYMHIISPET